VLSGLSHKYHIASYVSKHTVFAEMYTVFNKHLVGRVCGLVVTVPGYISRGPVSIPGTTRFSDK
jgi:hypothetical protein